MKKETGNLQLLHTMSQWFVTGSLLSRTWEFKHHRVLRLNVFALALLPITFVLKVGVLFTV